ncbi:hypothetical protein NC651_011559 [Populus alba x Populus x berolinensis]|nr:hypothetical protein NC651_011559 [Populus alba x Populus x berolinensis]
MKGSTSVYRTVTYYGTGPTAYVANVQVTVTPAHLKFTKTGENMSFRIDFKLLKTSDGNFVFGALTWSNGVHKDNTLDAAKIKGKIVVMRTTEILIRRQKAVGVQLGGSVGMVVIDPTVKEVSFQFVIQAQ